MSSDQSTRKAMRAGISGENVLRPLDEFSVTSKASTPTETYVYGRVDLSAFSDNFPRAAIIVWEPVPETDVDLAAAQIEADILAWVIKKAESARPSPYSMITGTGRFQQNKP